jgi:hypothetical protein
MESVEDVLNKFLGENTAKIILQHAQSNSLETEDVSKRAEAFSGTLHRMVGPGSIFIEKSILRHLYSTLGLEFEEKERYGFSDYLGQLKKKSRSRMTE